MVKAKGKDPPKKSIKNGTPSGIRKSKRQDKNESSDILPEIAAIPSTSVWKGRKIAKVCTFCM